MSQQAPRPEVTYTRAQMEGMKTVLEWAALVVVPIPGLGKPPLPLGQEEMTLNRLRWNAEPQSIIQGIEPRVSRARIDLLIESGHLVWREKTREPEELF